MEYVYLKCRKVNNSLWVEMVNPPVNFLTTKLAEELFRQMHPDDRPIVEHLLQGADRRTDPVLLDQRDQAVGDAGALGQFALREAVHRADGTQVGTDVEGHAGHGVFNILHTADVSARSFGFV